jgi:polysaccharide pyruvyl transferase WcaK-like protein
MKYYFPIHLDGGNRGCEAIAKGSALLIDTSANNLLGYCRDISLDTRLGVDNYLTLIPCRRNSYLVDRFLALINKVFNTEKTNEWRQFYPYKSFFQTITPDDIMISTGGDMLCYDNNEVVYTNNVLHRRGVRTILWGCSMGPENMTKEKLATLFKFSLIYTRESLTYNYFTSLGLKNLCLLPDPAFILPDEPCQLPECFGDNDVVGLNLSNYVMGGMTLDKPFGKEVLRLIDHIMKNTRLHILLIPHVTWNRDNVNQDDRQMAGNISRHFGNPERLRILDINTLNYCQIRHVISKCRMFIGARTHAVISAYAMCVPAIALGYSIKSRGIARDLGLEDSLVVNCKQFSEGDLLRSFLYLDANKDGIRKQLIGIMPEYIQRTYRIREHMKQITEQKS